MQSNDFQLFGGNWTEQKLKILAQYLKQYNVALQKQPFTRVYVDAFAGTGYRKQAARPGYPDLFPEIEEPEAQAFLKGSAKLALEICPSFHRYIFVESDAEKVNELERLKIEHPDKADTIEIEQGDANDYMRKYCKNMARSERAVVFLDPFATEVEWDTIEAIARTQAIDTWILFPMMAVNRLLANDPKKAFRRPLDRVFGSPDWFQRFYRSSVEENIFGQSYEIVQKACDFDNIREFFLERLKAVFAGVSPNPRMLFNSRGSPIFQLFFAAGNTRGAPIALKIANHLLEHL